MFKRFSVLALLVPVISCTSYVDNYEEAVHEMEPIYCYQTIGGRECHREPKHQDERRLVNYYGPHPSRYEKPALPPESKFKVPPKINFFVRDFEPIPQAVPRKSSTEPLPWKQEGDKDTSFTARKVANKDGVGAVPTSSAPRVSEEDMARLEEMARILKFGRTQETSPEAPLIVDKKFSTPERAAVKVALPAIPKLQTEVEQPVKMLGTQTIDPLEVEELE